jgi:DNA transposition AAA+ family ATPase
MNGFMSSVVDSREREEPSEEALVAKLRRFIEDSDLSFYQIASRVGTSGTMLSMWLAGTAKPDPAKSIEIDRFLTLS